MKKTITTLFGIIALIAFSPAANAADLANCEVGNSNSSGSGGLESFLTGFNSSSEATRMCKSSITFSVDKIYVYEQIVLKAASTETFHFGNSSSSDTTNFVVETSGSDPIIVVKNGIENVTIQNIKISKNSNSQGAFIKCSEGVDNLYISNVKVENRPIGANEISGCDNVTFSNFHVDYSLDDDAESASYPNYLIAVSGSDNFHFENSDNSNYYFDDIGGGAISIDDVQNYRIESLNINFDSSVGSASALISVTDSQAGTVNNMSGGLSSIKMYNVTGNGISLSDISNASDLTLSDITLDADDDNTGVGLKLTDVSQLDVRSITIKNFGSDGVQILGDSDNNIFSSSGVVVYDNGGYGFKVGGTSDSITISDTETTYNVNCGVYFDTAGQLNSVTGNNLFHNDGCGIGASGSAFVSELESDDVVVLARGEETVLVDINVETVNGIKAQSMELHIILPDGGSGTGDDDSNGNPAMPGPPSSGSSSQRSVKIATFDLSTVTPGMFGGGGITTYSIQPTSNTATVITDSRVSNSAYSICDNSDSCLPEESVAGVPVSSQLSAIVYGSEGQVIGYWNGVVDVDGSDNEANDRVGCYYDEREQEFFRIYDLELDSDGDGIIDWEEDSNYNCEHDEGEETNFNNEDTDNDGIIDGVETCVSDQANASCTETDPLDPDSDDDNLNDGEEDLNGDGFIDTAGNSIDGETYPNDGDSDDDGLTDDLERRYQTNPHVQDTDNDGENDDTDLCPLVPSDEQQCYYAYCVPSDENVSPSVNGGGDSETGEAGDDVDDDGIDNDVEDANGNCLWDEGEETNANDPDTDGDDIPDGVEDSNGDGEYDASEGETNPLSTDSDGDCISDDDEDKNQDGVTQIEDGETDPTLTDTDGDGISDGDEDNGDGENNCNGNVDPGETDPHLADTDGDGESDATDICPNDKNESCVVRYCGINGFEDYDTDGDGLTDVEEDFNGDCAWTESEREPNPLDPDTDDDGLNDSLEVECFGTNPIAADSDGDGRSDYEEVENSIDQCQAMYNLGDTDPLRAEYGGCSLAKNNATNGSNLPIILVIGGLLVSILITRKKLERTRA